MIRFKAMFTALTLTVLFTTGVNAENGEVQELANKWTQAYNIHNPAELGAVYTKEAHLYMHGAPMIIGRKDIESFWASDFKEGNPLTLLTVTHSVEGIDMTLVHGDYQVIDREDGSQLGAGRFAHIWINKGDGWKLDRDLWNQPSAPQE